jgi:hypothetical protein
MTTKVEQCQFYGQRRRTFMGRTTNELVRCQERSDSFWHDELGDAYCPRHERQLKRRAAARS